MSGKIIFLDVDGVLNNRFTETKTKAGWVFVEDFLVAHLKHIIDVTHAEVVLSSTWRWGHWSHGTDRDDYLELIDKLASFGIKIKDITPAFSMPNKEDEILWWLEHRHDGGNFVILDDVDDFTVLHGHLVETDPDLGLTAKDVAKAIEILNREVE